MASISFLHIVTSLVERGTRIVKQLPDLPFLESVEISLPHWPAYAAIFIVVTFIFPIISLFRRCYPMESNLLFGFIFGLVVSGGLIVWILYRLLCSTYYWKTDTSGLTTSSLTKRKFTRWQDVEASPRVPDTDSHSSRMEILEASIFQHLRRHGKQDLLPIKEQALSLWDTIPDDLPTDLEWENPRRVQRTILYATTVCITLVTLGLGFTTIRIFHGRHSDTAFLAVMTIVYAFVIWFGIVHQNRLQSIRASLRGEVLEIQTVSRSITLKASDLSSAWWGEPGMLHLKTVDKVHLLIPLDSIYDKSSMMVLGIIRWLRTADNPIAISIPDILRSTKYNPVKSTDGDHSIRTDTVNIGLSTADRMIFLGMGAFLGIASLAVIFKLMPPPKIAAAITVIVSIIFCVAIWWATGTIATTANSEGITETFLWRKKLVKWSDIANYTFGFRGGSGIQYQSLRHILWASNGKQLLTLWGGSSQWEELLRVLHTEISRVLPQDVLSKPWKSRPWTES